MQLLSTKQRFTGMTREQSQQEEPMSDTAEVAVERWVHAHLVATYQQVLDEPIPDELLRVLEMQFAS